MQNCIIELFHTHNTNKSHCLGQPLLETLFLSPWNLMLGPIYAIYQPYIFTVLALCLARDLIS